MKRIVYSLLIFCCIGACMADSRRDKALELMPGYLENCRTFTKRYLEYDAKKYGYLLAWGASYYMDAIIEGYLFSGNTEYLDLFVQFGDKTVESRADVIGIPDYKGRLRKGWLADPYYGTGGPVVFYDKDGKPSLEIRSTALCYNDRMDVYIGVNDDNTFSIETKNEQESIAYLCKKIDGLTMENVEETINTPTGYTAVKVKKVGNNPPTAIGPVRMTPNDFVMHAHHTGKSVIPLLRFAKIIKEHPEYKAKYGEAASRYLKCAKEAMDDMNDDWREHPDGGFLIFEKGMPFWCDGVPEANNVMVACAISYLYLYQLTGEFLYWERAVKLATFVRKELIDKPDGTVMYYYWTRLNREGWTSESEYTSENSPNFRMTPSAEDMSHMQASLRFFAIFYRNRMVFRQDDMQKLAKTFHVTIDFGDNPKEGKKFADSFDGGIRGEKDTYQTFQAGWAEFDEIDSTIVDRIWDVFIPTIKGTVAGSRLYTQGVLMRAILTRK